MKALVYIGIALFAFQLGAQESQVVERGAHHNVIEQVKTIPLPEGDSISVTNRYIELADGLNYLENNQWVPSVAEFALVDGYAVATQGQSKVSLPANINQAAAVQFISSAGREFLSNPLFLALRDPDSGESVAIAVLQDSQGVQVAPDQIVYPDAFVGDISASIRMTVRLSGLEQDILIHNAIDPADWELGPNTVIESWTETFDWPAPEQIQVVKAGDMDDIVIKWPEFRIGAGKAFGLDGQVEQVPVAKRFGPIAGRQFLVEIVQAQAVGPLMARLPAPGAAERILAKKARKSKDAKALLASVKPRTRPKGQKQVASIQRREEKLRSCVVLDYSTLTTPQSGFTFEGNTVYLLTGSVSLQQTTTLVGGTVIKLDTGGSLNIQGPLVCQTSPYRLAIITSKLDGSVGEIIATGPPTTKTYGSPALNLNPSTTTAYKLHDIAIRWADKAIQVQNASLVVTNLQVVSCNTAIYKASTATTLDLKNALMDDVGVILDGSSSGANTGQHLTCHRVSNFMQGTVSAIALENSLLMSVTNTAGKYTGSSVVALLDDTGVFAPQVGVGRHYLAANSPYRNNGTAISDAQFLVELQSRTTYAPSMISGYQTGGATLWPRVPTDQGILDYGYHYSVCDYLVTDAEFNAPVVLTNGVVLGCAGTSGLRCSYSSTLTSEGSPTRLNRLVWCNQFQESPVSTGAAPGDRNLIEISSNLTPQPTLRLRFTEGDMAAGDGRFMYFGNLQQTYNPAYLSIQDCSIRGGSFALAPSVSGSTFSSVNSLWENCNITLWENTGYSTTTMWVTFRNNLVRRGTVALNKNSTATPWTLNANLFDTASVGATLGTGVSLATSFNGYRTGVSRLPGETSYQDVATFNYMTGPLGEYY
ncbi:MAG: hypothetical protein HYR88_16505, partial [Verrucomicrobia bacterium]|nr:hypothetical protein [Verrucomicrobiota bacterium]